jgi:CPA2 family monovalent cation:H+ antiporter-2
MPHSVSLISTIAAGLGLALIFGFIAARMKLPSLVGYLLAGVLIGPFTPGFVADAAIASQLAEIGVMLLMFGVGLHFSLGDLLAVRKIAVPGAVVQMTVATALGMGLAHWWGWNLGGALVFGLSLSVASTVVLLRALETRGVLDSANGRIAVGWLVVEDLAMVLVLVLLPPLAEWLSGRGQADVDSLGKTLGITLLQAGGFVALMLVVGRRFFPWVLWQVQRTGSRELFTLCVVAAAVGIAFGATALFGVSFALGAFFAGMVMRESEFSHRAAQETLPLRDAFAVLFFVSVGMLFDFGIILSHPLALAGTLFIILFGKSIAALVIVLAFGHPIRTALTISASLAQIGEFSFILAGLGVGLQILPPEGRDLILAGALISIVANPIFFYLIDRLAPPPLPAAQPAAGTPTVPTPGEVVEEPAVVPVTALDNHAVLIGYGRVGRVIGEELTRRKLPFLVVEEQAKLASELRARGVEAVSANGALSKVLEAANLKGARWLFVAIPDAFEAGQIVSQARDANPALPIIARAHSDAEVEHLTAHGATHTIMGEREIALGMLEFALGMSNEEGSDQNRNEGEKQ